MKWSTLRKLAAFAARGDLDFGWCSVCDQPTAFLRHGPWLRDQYECGRCRSIPRQRAFVHALRSHVPEWRRLRVHESSPSGPSSAKVQRECAGYSASHYFPGRPRGAVVDGWRNEDLEALTFEDGAFDVFLTQDVVEHVLDPERAFAEIARVLAPGGVHLFTVGIHRGKRSLIRARRAADGSIRHFAPPDHHVNPIDPAGSLVTTEWGLDIIDTIYAASGMRTTVFEMRSDREGLVGEFLEVLVSRK